MKAVVVVVAEVVLVPVEADLVVEDLESAIFVMVVANQVTFRVTVDMDRGSKLLSTLLLDATQLLSHQATTSPAYGLLPTPSKGRLISDADYEIPMHIKKGSSS
jgi:hypothetical protein